MAGEQANRDQNHVTSMLFTGSDGATYNVHGDQITGRMYVDLAGGSGTVTSVSVVTANGVSGSVATATTTPAITLTLGAITPSSVQVSGLTASQILSTDASKNLTSLDTVTYPSLTELSYVKGVTSAIQTQLNTKGAGTVTASGGALTANSVVLGAGTTDTKVVAGIITDGVSVLTLGVNVTTIGKVKMFGNTSGDVTILPNAVAGTATTQTLPATTGVLVNRVTTGNGVSASNTDGALAFTLGAITPSTVNGNTFTAGTYTLTGTAAKTLNFTNTLTLSGTDATTMTFPTTSATIARTDAANTFTGIQSMTSPDITTSITTATTSFTAWAGATTLLTIGGTGASASLFAPSTLDATSSTTGAIRTSGGISAAKALNVGTNITSAGAIIYTNNAIAASGNAATVPVTAKLNTVTNNSAATLTITMTTASAVDGQMTIVRILDFSAAAQTITWVNTENSTVTAPVTSNGSTTLFLTVGFIYNGGTSKWRCIASA